MAEEYKGKSIFSRRYVGMSEEAIREEIDRLQGRVHALEKALDSLQEDDKNFINAIEDNQRKMEKLIIELDKKITKLQSSLDYDAPIKTQLDTATKDISAKLKAANKESVDKLIVVLQFNTALLIILLGVVVYNFIIR
ncbi:hypothetical protein SAMN05421493_10190 [Pseudobutyrivibrio sp. 49]|uniref:hypothetical protein n=1 Tax=unclassified Pseudobutyrivibrio TaxID=2638619 RepID=UPI00088E28E7|nr:MULTISPECIES: hypothetical protein [unclassified Pseudobutyrivibrio]SDH27840.1 hypothetical protein SAMN05421493_10190 [Pseudobutyrivibrio sp. 49]SFN53616.1 hypothetical protein SAMN04487831_101591 [Pseudobutyrivibrio sp. UC1225]